MKSTIKYLQKLQEIGTFQKVKGHLKGAPAVAKWIQTVKMNDGYYRRQAEKKCKEMPRGQRKNCQKAAELKILQNTLKNLKQFMNGTIGKEFRNGCNNPLLDKQVCVRLFTLEINRTQKKIIKLR